MGGAVRKDRHNYVGWLPYAPLGARFIARNPAARGNATVSQPPHVPARGDSGKTTGDDDGLGERGAWRAALLTMARSLTRSGGGPPRHSIRKQIKPHH